MTRLKLTGIAALLAGLLAQAAPAQTVANLSIVSGNGQLLNSQNFVFFEPLQVKATDASGNPVANATITWAAFGQVNVMGAGTFTSMTGSDGIASTTPYSTLVTTFGSQPFVQSTVTASANSGASATFTLSQALTGTAGGYTYSLVQASRPNLNGNIIYDNSSIGSGQAGVQGANPLTVSVAGVSGQGVPNVSVRLVSSQTSPTIACVTGAGADPGSVLTDSSGLATCNLMFGGSGAGQFIVIVGGVTYSGIVAGPLGFAKWGPFDFSVTGATPSQIQIVSGNSQSGNPGQALASALVAKIADAGGNAISGQNVTWTVSPAGAATLTGVSTTSDNNGQVSASVTLAGSAAGSVQVKVALQSNPAIAQTFTVTANAVISGLQKVGNGDQQSALVNAAFAQPLVVQVNGTNGQPLSGYPVAFAITGGARLSSASVTTGANGRAQVDVTAGATAGPVTVTATAGTFTVTFNLTVLPPGPALTAGSFYNAAGFQPGSISPCGIAAIIAPGLAPGIQNSIGPPLVGQLPYQIALGTAGTVVSVSFNNSQAPIYSVSNMNGQEQLTVEVPCDVAPGNATVTVNVGAGKGTATVNVLPASPGIFTYPDTDGVMRAVLTRPDGTFVGVKNPARRGEIVRAYVTGLGPVAPAVGTNSLPGAGADALVQGTVVVGVTDVNGNGKGVRVDSARLSPDLIGVYEIPFQMPVDAAQGGNVAFSVAVIPTGSSTAVYGNTTKIAIQ